MVWPASVVTRQISFGKAVILETGEDLSVRLSTRANRSLISQVEGYRMESVVASFNSSTPGEVITFPLPVTNQAGWLDADTRMPIEVGPNKHTHLYTTTLTIFKGSSTIAEYVIGPYPMPSGGGIIDGDTMLIPSGTQEGVLVPLPVIWQQVIDSANAALKGTGSTAGQVWTSNGPNTPAAWKNPTGGGGGGTPAEQWLLPVIFANGSYPTQPATPPPGVKVRWFFGPEQYVGPVYPGIIDKFSLTDLT